MIFNKNYYGHRDQLKKPLTINEFKMLFEISDEEFEKELWLSMSEADNGLAIWFEEYISNRLVNQIFIIMCNNMITHITHTEGD